VGPHQKLRRHEIGSLPDLTQSSQRLSHLDVTQTSGIMMSLFPFPPEMVPPLGILTIPVLLFPFCRIDPAITTFGSTESELTGRSVPLSGLVRLRTMGPLQKLGRHESGSLPDLTQSSQRLSHLDVTQPSGTMRFPSHYTQKGSTRYSWSLIRVSSPLSYPEPLPLMLSFSLPLQSPNSPCTKPIKRK
jgi:hypothetical protein